MILDVLGRFVVLEISLLSRVERSLRMSPRVCWYPADVLSSKELLPA